MLLMKFPTSFGTGAIQGDQLSERTCYAIALKSATSKLPSDTMSVLRALNGTRPIDDPREETPTPQAQTAEDLETVVLNDWQPDRYVKIGTTLAPSL
ncbi:unnamed protein product [Prunus armeniaca]